MKVKYFNLWMDKEMIIILNILYFILEKYCRWWFYYFFNFIYGKLSILKINYCFFFFYLYVILDVYKYVFFIFFY